jgi:hypothetical protein
VNGKEKKQTFFCCCDIFTKDISIFQKRQNAKRQNAESQNAKRQIAKSQNANSQNANPS